MKKVAADYPDCLRACAEGRSCVRIVLPLRGGAPRIGRRGMVGPFYYEPGWMVFATRMRFGTSTSTEMDCRCRMRCRAFLQPGSFALTFVSAENLEYEERGGITRLIRSLTS